MRRQITALVTVLIGLLIVPAVSAETVRAQMSVSATVIARALLSVQQQPDAIVVTPLDLTRGYVDVDAPFVVTVRTNSRSGYLLEATNIDSAFASAEIASDNLSLHVTNQSWIGRPYTGLLGEQLRFRVRLILSSSAHEGSYPFPIALSATPVA